MRNYHTTFSEDHLDYIANMSSWEPIIDHCPPQANGQAGSIVAFDCSWSVKHKSKTHGLELIEDDEEQLPALSFKEGSSTSGSIYQPFIPDGDDLTRVHLRHIPPVIIHGEQAYDHITTVDCLRTGYWK